MHLYEGQGSPSLILGELCRQLWVRHLRELLSLISERERPVPSRGESCPEPCEMRGPRGVSYETPASGIKHFTQEGDQLSSPGRLTKSPAPLVVYVHWPSGSPFPRGLRKQDPGQSRFARWRTEHALQPGARTRGPVPEPRHAQVRSCERTEEPYPISKFLPRLKGVSELSPRRSRSQTC